jgi:hypothetical protein
LEKGDMKKALIVFGIFLLVTQPLSAQPLLYRIKLEGRTFTSPPETASLMACSSPLSSDSDAYASVWYALPDVLAARGITVTADEPEATITVLLQHDRLDKFKQLRLVAYPYSEDDWRLCDERNAPFPFWTSTATVGGSDTDMTRVGPLLLDTLAPHIGAEIDSTRTVRRK